MLVGSDLGIEFNSTTNHVNEPQDTRVKFFRLVSEEEQQTVC